MHGPERDSEDHERGNDPPDISSPEQEHKHQPEETRTKSSNSNNKFYLWIKTHWGQLKDLGTHDKLNLLFTSIIAIATTVYVIVASLQLGAMRSQTDTMQKQLTQMELQLPELQKSTKAAQDSAILTRQQVIAAQAAVLGIRFDILYRFLPGEPHGLRSVIEYRSGSALATNVHVSIDASWKDARELKDIGSSQHTEFDIPLMRSEGARGVIRMASLDGLNADKWESIRLRSNAKTIGVRGTFRYHNGFDSIPDQPFCFVWFAHPTVLGNSAADFVDCAEYKRVESMFASFDRKAKEAKQ